MNKILPIALIVGFAFVDFLFFHDFLKPGETISPAQYFTGALSVMVFFLSARLLLEAKKTQH